METIIHILHEKCLVHSFGTYLEQHHHFTLFSTGFETEDRFHQKWPNLVKLGLKLIWIIYALFCPVNLGYL